MSKSPKFYKDRVCLNVLVGSIENAKECYEASEGHIVLGLLSKNYESDKLAIDDMKKYADITNNAISVGLGAGDPNQSAMVSRISKVLQPQHVNQVFTGASTSREAVANNDTFINALISPTGKVGYVNIATGPFSSKEKPAEIHVETAIALLKDMGASSIKYFNMKGLEHRDEYIYISESCAKSDFALEPTGGIDLNNFEEILQIALTSGVKKIIPHVYTSIIDKETGNTRVNDVKKLYEIIKKLV